MAEPVILHVQSEGNPWPDGRGIDVAVVRGRLADIAAHFHVPIMQEGRTLLGALLVVPGAGLVSVVNQNIDGSAWEPEPLTPEEVEHMVLTEQHMALVIGIGADANLARSWVGSTFPPSLLVHFSDVRQS